MRLVPCLLEAVARRAKDFDVIHAHIDWLPLPLLSRLGVPFLTTMHGEGVTFDDLSATLTKLRGLKVHVIGDTIIDTLFLNRDPKFLGLGLTGGAAYSLNGDGTVNYFSISPNGVTSDVVMCVVRKEVGSTKNALEMALSTMLRKARFSAYGRPRTRETPSRFRAMTAP